MPPAPSEQDVVALAERALGFAGTAAQVTASWELRLSTRPRPTSESATRVEFVCLDRGVGRAVAEGVDDAGLREAAGRARELARVGEPEPRAAELPEPAAGRPHQGWDPAVLRVDPAEVARELDETTDELIAQWRAGAARTAIASTTGVHAFEQRSFEVLHLAQETGGRTVVDSAAAVGAGDIDVDDSLARISGLTSPEKPGRPRAGEFPVVLGPEAVAVVLDLIRPHFGVLAASGQSAVADRLGRRVVAPCINLSDSPRFPGTLPRSYDAEGVPRQPLPLVQDGVAHRVVRDSASPGGPSTGHATIPLRVAPVPQHLVLVGGGAADEDELMSPITHGVFIPALSGDGTRALGAFAIEDGGGGVPLADFDVEVDGLAVLAAAQALTMGQRLVAGRDSSARTIGASMCPALRASAGVRIRV